MCYVLNRPESLPASQIERSQDPASTSNGSGTYNVVAESAVTPQVIANWILTPIYGWFGLRRERARGEDGEKLKQQDGSHRALCDLDARRRPNGRETPPNFYCWAPRLTRGTGVWTSGGPVFDSPKRAAGGRSGADWGVPERAARPYGGAEQKGEETRRRAGGEGAAA
ncbi:hypothetical protein NDU88_006501 [Pleurodeles waltl]|uniref:Uncharacterized protein n=1 Tax=Pleurodeles waltl TaxID=8319 RepID=A0AAV7TXF3_PLEWA|nr:hypothetical protein NDU88_006501 [Pleurodeles waltl]